MSEPGVERRLAAILSADAVGYSRLMADDEVATVRTMVARRNELSNLVQLHGGRVVDAPGDNLLAEFPAATSATECAVEFQRTVNDQNAELPERRRMPFRIGLHIGEVLVEGERIYGDGINVAARLEGLADPGGIACSGALRDQVLRRVSSAFEDGGEHQLKNLPDPVHVWRVKLDASVPTATVDAPTPESATLVVLPFANRSEDSDQEYFADGISEELITALSKLPGLLVIARTSAFAYKGKSLRVDEIGRELNVRYVLEGSVRRSGPRVRIHAQLSEAASGHPVWVERYDRTLEDIFAVQDDVTTSIVSALQVELAPVDSGRATAPPTANLESYDLYLRGSHYLRRFQREAVLHARELFERALELDPVFALAKQAVANTYCMEFAFSWTSDLSAIERAEALAREAIALDPKEAEARISLARIQWMKGSPEMLESARTAVELAPGHSEAQTLLGMTLRAAGRVEESAAHTELAARLDPNDTIAHTELTSLQYQLGQLEDGAAAGRRAVALAPDFPPAHLNLCACYVSLGRMEAARACVSEILRIAPDYSIGELRRRVRGIPNAEALFADLRKAGLPD